MTSKCRDEMKPRFGLIRGKQFDMKDMYSFDVDSESATETYQTICDSYNVVFEKFGFDFIKVLGSTEIIRGKLSYEYHYRADIGDDTVLICNNCNYAANMELLEEGKCKRSDSVQLSSAIELVILFREHTSFSKHASVGSPILSSIAISGHRSNGKLTVCDDS